MAVMVGAGFAAGMAACRCGLDSKGRSDLIQIAFLDLSLLDLYITKGMMRFSVLKDTMMKGRGRG